MLGKDCVSINLAIYGRVGGFMLITLMKQLTGAVLHRYNSDPLSHWSVAEALALT